MTDISQLDGSQLDGSGLDGVEPLLVTQGSLAHGVPDHVPGTLYARSLSGGVRLRPRPDRKVTFGRNKPEVQVCVGGDDQNVSRKHGTVTFHDGAWWLRNIGRRNLQLPGTQQLFTESDPYPLAPGYTPVFIRTAGNRSHLVEIYVSDGTGQGPVSAHGAPTFEGHQWLLDRREKLALIATAQPYLLHEDHPEPWSREAVANLLDEIDPTGGWTVPVVGHTVDRVRKRLAKNGVPGLLQDEVGQRGGSRLKHNLIMELLASRTLVPPDLAILD
ncbi:FHA domain-containing protein [Promicromonospora sp. AC04]|uniref:FHA domain-containing protein n=1 Tax=Promicromonospora sp. AC04 TaxID=2135723 RepID=UPI000D350663|nr:FHA domain-containing protein [Promicromonospora sp. AC04]PUB24946.1 FHA domain-containing protein [Promicromonospora sp. AC04]